MIDAQKVEKEYLLEKLRQVEFDKTDLEIQIVILKTRLSKLKV